MLSYLHSPQPPLTCFCYRDKVTQKESRYCLHISFRLNRESSYVLASNTSYSSVGWDVFTCSRMLGLGKKNKKNLDLIWEMWLQFDRPGRIESSQNQWKIYIERSYTWERHIHSNREGFKDTWGETGPLKNRVKPGVCVEMQEQLLTLPEVFYMWRLQRWVGVWQSYMDCPSHSPADSLHCWKEKNKHWTEYILGSLVFIALCFSGFTWKILHEQSKLELWHMWPKLQPPRKRNSDLIE